MNRQLHNLFKSQFYIHEAFALACAASVFNPLVNVSYQEKDQDDLIAECIAVDSASRPASEARNVAIITFNQPVVKYDYGYWLGTQTFIRILDRFKADPSIAGVVVAIDSGGGQVYGTPEFYDYVLDFRQTKPYVVYSGGYLCSGAYYIAAPGDYIVVNKRADAVGSIGAYTVKVNLNGLYEKYGAKIYTIYSSLSEDKNKAHRAIMENGDEAAIKDYVKTELDPLVVDFQNDMKAVRPQIKEEAFKGGTWQGPQAVEMGLADEVGTLETAIAKVYELAESNSNNKKQKKKSMAKTTSLPHLQAALGVEGDLKLVTKTISGKTGLFIEEAKLAALNKALADNEAAVTTANGKVTAAEGKVTTLETAVNTAVKTAGLDAEVEADATTETKITLLGSKVKEYGAKPGTKGAAPKADGDRFEEGDEESSNIYNQITS